MTDNIQETLAEIFREEAEELLLSWESCVLKLQDNFDSEDLNDLFRIAHTIKGSSKAVGMDEVGEFVHHVEDFIRSAQSEFKPKTDIFMHGLLSCHKVLTEMIHGIEVSEREKNKAIKELENSFEEHERENPSSSSSKLIAIAETPEQKNDKNVENLKTIAEKDKKDISVKKKKSKPLPLNSTIRVNQRKIDGLINIIGEISNQLAIMDFYYDDRKHENALLRDALSSCIKYSKNMQESVLSLSMQPLDRFFQKLERAGLDVANSENKKVKIIKEGGEIELDKTVLDRISEPFVHIIRNAVDHGIEKKEDRIDSSKNDEGNILIKAEQGAGIVNITIQDDGKGLDPKFISQKAIKKGLIKENSSLSDEEIFNLLLLPGFSTKETVTNISGRGVGMDVVNSTLQSLGGNITISSKKGYGSSFKVSIPTNFALMESLIVEIKGTKFGVPLKEFSEVIDLCDFKVHINETGNNYFNLRDEIVPISSLDSFLPFDGFNEDKNSPSRAVLVSRISGKALAFRIDSLKGQCNLFVKPTKGKMENMLGVSGTAILPDGKAGIVLSLTELTQIYAKQFEEARRYG